MPVHNEGASIEATLRDWHRVLSQYVNVTFIICEDGSKDNTKEVLRRLETELPLILDISEARRGYGGAMLAGLRAAITPWVMTADSDGQADPNDFPALWAAKDDCDLIVGWRFLRKDKFIRLLLSRSFRVLHRILFGSRLHDPSCNVMLMRRTMLDQVLPKMDRSLEGFQWEFVARVLKAKVKIKEMKVQHRERAAGGTVVYHPKRLPGIGWRNTKRMFQIWLDR